MRLMKNYKDPHKEREAKKYDRPIPSRELMLEVMEKPATQWDSTN